MTAGNGKQMTPLTKPKRSRRLAWAAANRTHTAWHRPWAKKSNQMNSHRNMKGREDHQLHGRRTARDTEAPNRETDTETTRGTRERDGTEADTTGRNPQRRGRDQENSRTTKLLKTEENCTYMKQTQYGRGARGTSRDVKQQRLGQARQEATQVREEYDAGARANPYAGVLSTRHPPAPTTVHPTYSPGSDGIPHRVLPPPTCYLKGATATPRHSFHRSHPLHSSPSNPSLVNSDLGNPMCCPSYFRV